MKIKRAWHGAYYVVFSDADEAYKWDWLFYKILRRPLANFGVCDNAYYLFG